jgi:subtilisin-like proprotein convertase family protein
VERRRSRLVVIFTLVLTLCATIGLAISADAIAKKKKKKNKVVNITMPVNQQVPDATQTGTPAVTVNGVLPSSITVAGKAFKRLAVRDVNVTLQTTGSSGAPGTPSSAGQLAARLTAPDGTTVWLFGSASLVGQSVGPLTLDDQSVFSLSTRTPAQGPPPDSTSLISPYQGTAQPDCFESHGNCALTSFDNGPVIGTWTLRVYDTFLGSPTATSVLNSWTLQVFTGKRYKT